MPKTQHEDGCEQKEEAARDLKPDNASNAPEWAQESADSLAEVAAGLSYDPHGGLRRGVGLGDRTRSGRNGLAVDQRCDCGRLRGTANALAGNAPKNAHADAESTADISGIHTVYDGSSGSRCLSWLDVGA